MILLLICSALISGSEVAFFSLSPSDIDSVTKKQNSKNIKLLHLLNKPEELLATILITNNFINIGIVILSSFITNSLIDFSSAPSLGFLFQVVIVTFILLLFGEIIPKVYATQSPLNFSRNLSTTLFHLKKLFYPFSFILIKSTSLVNKYINKEQNISMKDLSQALELTGDINEEMEILEGIIRFGSVNVSDIMTSRVDVTCIEINEDYNKLKTTIINSGYSRIPIYEDSFDHIKGILYVKDLLPHLDKGNSFKWQNIIRPSYYVPETKKINDLLKEFQAKKTHLAIVIDEYGGSSGIITLEDVLEEIVGEISDESDETKDFYKKEKDGSYIFEGKTLLNDFFKIVNIPNNSFDNVKGDAETLAGLILEIKREIPTKNDSVEINKNKFTILKVDKRRIIEIRFKNSSKKNN